MVVPGLVQCAANDEAVKVVEIYKPFVVVVTATKYLHLHHMPKQGVFLEPTHSVTFRRLLLRCVTQTLYWNCLGYGGS